MALEVERLQETAKRSEMEIETDRVRHVLLKYMVQYNQYLVFRIIQINTSHSQVCQKGRFTGVKLFLSDRVEFRRIRKFPSEKYTIIT